MSRASIIASKVIDQQEIHNLARHASSAVHRVLQGDTWSMRSQDDLVNVCILASYIDSDGGQFICDEMHSKQVVGFKCGGDKRF
jgi:hypothetical protein